MDAHETQLLNRYLQLLQRWNKVYNLTAVRDPAEMQSLAHCRQYQRCALSTRCNVS